ncbi:EAL domain-containing protein [Micromonospora sp. NPDC049903]|uniref:EAL domain-containing protein n=1 Tax=Micromonospora sp. NPDC049903 TaxID=3364276 RepID=UPI0037B906F8
MVVDEATRSARAAELAKLGTIIWTPGTDAIEGAEHLTWSDEMAMIFGHAPGTLRLTFDALVELVHPDDVHRVRHVVRAAWIQKRPDEFTFRVIQPGGSVRHVQIHLEIVESAGKPTGMIATGEDVTSFELARQERRRLTIRSRMLSADLAERDILTGLSTRSYLTDEVDRARRSTGGALIIVTTEPSTRPSDALSDADRDELTASVAGLLRAIVGDKVTCGLVGAGLWGVLVTSVEHTDAAALAARIVDRFKRHLFGIRQPTSRLNTWAGVVHFHGDVHASGSDLLVDAEHAAYDARANAIPVTVLDEPVLDQDRIVRCRARVRRAVASSRFALYAQPIVDLRLNQVTRHEILLRVRNETDELVAPWAFLDMAERVGEILAVDKWVVDHALELIGRGAQTSHYQVNISGKSLADPGLLSHVTESIQRHHVRPECLTFEITETALIENRNEALGFASGIREIGCGLALDDFGTGYATLSHLKYLPVDLIKIDGTFVSDLQRSPANQAIVSSMVRLGHDLGIQVAAEHVQDEETIELLKNCGVDFAQGYQTGRPQPIAATPEPPVRSIEFEFRLPPQYTALG